MTHWTEAELEQYMLKRERLTHIPSPTGKDTPDEGPESRLQGKIQKWCKDWGRPCQCFRKSRKAHAFLIPGWVD